jgi:hypothetical protein
VGSATLPAPDTQRAQDYAASLRLAVGTVAAEVAASARSIERVVFCCFAPDAADHYGASFTELGLA